MCYLSPWKGRISPLDHTQFPIACRCTLLAENSSIRLAGSEEQINFSRQSHKMLKWLFCFVFVFLFLFFFNVGLFLKIFRRVPLCTTPQHKLWHEKINTQYENKHENTSFSKQNQKKSKDNDSYHNLYETTITVFFFLSLTIYRLVYTQHKYCTSFSSNYSCCNLLQLSKSLHS